MAFSCGFVTFSCHFVGKGKARDKLQKLNSVELIVRFGLLSLVAFEIVCLYQYMGARTQDWACLSAVGLIASDGEHVFGTVCIYVCLKVCLLRKKNRTKNM